MPRMIFSNFLKSTVGWYITQINVISVSKLKLFVLIVIFISLVYSFSGIFIEIENITSRWMALFGLRTTVYGDIWYEFQVFTAKNLN